MLRWGAQRRVPVAVTRSKRPRAGDSTSGADDDFDDNPDDSYSLRNTNYRPKMTLNCLFSGYACSWQCGGQGFEFP